MGETTDIGWTYGTWNPWFGCIAVSPGCANCYAAALAARYGWPWGQDQRGKYGDKHWLDPVRWNKKAERAGTVRTIFPAMIDPFEGRPEMMTTLARFFRLIQDTPWLQWLLLTKRPENIIRLWPIFSSDEGTNSFAAIPNVRLMTSCEDQKRADMRIPELFKAASILGLPVGLSCEPLLGPLDLSAYMDGLGPSALFIVGGESGPKHRHMELAWAASLRDQARASATPYYFKQTSAFKSNQRGDCPDDLWIREMPPPMRAPNTIWTEAPANA